MIGIVLDMDDTLYAERDYVKSGFRSVAALVGDPSGPSVEEVFEFLWQCFEQGVRGDTFQKLFDRFNSLAGRFTIQDLVQRYREHRPTLMPYAGVSAQLAAWRAQAIPLALISDGGEQEQQRKLDELDLASYFDPVLLTGRWGREFWKPHPRAFEAVELAWSRSGSELVYIADNPAKDFLEPNRRGWRTLRLCLDVQLRCRMDAPSTLHAAQFSVHSWNALDEQVRSWLDV